MEQVTIQQGLNEVVIKKVQRMIQGKETGVKETMSRLVQEGQIAQDYVVPLGVKQRRMEETPVVRFGTGDELVMNMRGEQFSLHENAVGQLAEKMNIPSQYLRGLARGGEWQKHLAVTVLNEHSSQTNRQRVLIRSVGTEVRGVLSDSYRRLNSVQILTAFVEEAGRQGAVIADARMTDTKIWTETILPMPITIPTLKNGDVVIFMGARFSTSDYGDGAVDFSQDAIMQKAIEIQGVSTIDVDLDSELKKLVKVGSLNKSDSESVQKILMRNNPEDGAGGESTLWKLTQAITAHARDLDDRRRHELHKISGQLMNRFKSKAY